MQNLSSLSIFHFWLNSSISKAEKLCILGRQYLYMFPRTEPRVVYQEYFSSSLMYWKKYPPETLKLSQNKFKVKKKCYFCRISDPKISREAHKIILSKLSVELLMNPFGLLKIVMCWFDLLLLLLIFF